MTEKIPFITDVLELYTKTPEGLPLWKPKGVELTYENLLEKIIILSSDLAIYFNIKHNDLFRRNISKLQKAKYLPDQLRIFAQLIAVGKSAKKTRIVCGLTRHQTERLIMDFSGPKAREKKFEILMRLQSIEEDVLRGAYAQAREKASTWDGVQLLKDFGFTCSVSDDIATKQDIADFLKIPESTLNSFLNKHRDEIESIQLDIATIRSIGRKANRMNGYHLDEVAKIAFGMDTEVGIDLKKRIFGQLGTFANFQIRDEIQWRKVLAEVFKCFDLRYNYTIGKYRVDFFVANMGTGLVLECNGFSHRYYDPKEEAEREKAITEKYALVRFHPKVSLETLVNGILQAKAGSVIRLYDLKDICRENAVNLN